MQRKFDKKLFKSSVINNVKNLFRKTIDEATPMQMFQAVSYAEMCIRDSLRLGCAPETIRDACAIDLFFIDKIKNIVDEEREIKAHPGDLEVLKDAKQMGFSDREIAALWGVSEIDIFNKRKQEKITPVYKMIDSCASEFDSYIPYFYSTCLLYTSFHMYVAPFCA